MSRWALAIYVWTRAGFLWSKSNVGKPAPASLDLLKMSLRWKGVRTLLEAVMASTA